MTISRTPHYASLSDTPGHLIRRCQQRALQIFEEVLGDFGLTQPQAALLLELARHPGASVQTLADSTGTDRNTLADIIARLTRNGLIKRERAVSDARAYELKLSPAGTRLLKRMEPGLAEVQRRILAPLPAKERAAFVRYARLIADVHPDSEEP